jgi:PAS domain S-box-containing protein
MTQEDKERTESRQLRAVALKNVERIQIARQRAEQELLAANEALQRRTEELERQREWFAVTLGSIGDAVITADISGNVTFLNPIAESLTGWPNGEAVGQPLESVFRIIDEDTRQPAANPVSQVLRLGKSVGLANHSSLIRRDDTERSIEDSAAPIRDRAGLVIGAVMVFRDVTEQRQAQKELRRSERLLADFFDNAAVGLHWVGPDGTILRVNQTELDLVGYAKEEYVGRHITEFHADRPVIDDILQRLSCGECLQNYEARLRCKDGGTKHVLISSNVLRENGEFIHTRCFTRDITAQKEAEIALREEIATRERAEAALRDADRRKDEFLATLAHELRNPLSPIRQAAMISQSPGATEAQKRWSHEVISRQVHHMSLLLDDLLDISRVTRGTLELRIEMTELAAVVDAAIETARPLIDTKRHELHLELPPKEVTIAADPLRLAQILSNLLTNAAKYTDPGGEIRVRIAIGVAEIEIEVSDNGIGLSPEGIARVFLMFSQVRSSHDRAEGGLGIGLALTKGLIELHGGRIEARSAGLGKGSQFVVRLPRRTIRASRESANGGSFSGAEAAKRRVLIADDNLDAAESLAILLRLDGHAVVLASTGREAVSRFEEGLPEVVVLDIGMPELDGYEVARQIRRTSAGREALLIALTGWGQAADKERALAAGFDHHFTKPVAPDQLQRLLQREFHSA